MNAVSLEQLQGHPVLRIFKNITEIPHGSKEEALLGDWVVEFATGHHWQVSRDEIGNILITVPGTAGRETATSVCLQAHLDMVCLDEMGNAFGAERFPLQLRLEDGWLKATGTTLGADNGIGIALALAIASECEHGPLEILLTVQEETGLDGAAALKFPLQSEKLLNLDSEDWGILFIGCAGGCGATIEVSVPYQRTSDTSHGWRLEVTGLQGGHSGMEINKGRENAVRVLAETIAAINFHQQIQLWELSGGARSNAIPASAQAVFVSNGDAERLNDLFSAVSSTLATDYEATEPRIQFSLEAIDAPMEAMDATATNQLLDFIRELPNGVISMSAIEDVPQTSINLGVAQLNPELQRLSLTLMARSSDAGDLTRLKKGIEAICQQYSESHEALVIHLSYGEGYPGWNPDPDAPLVQTIQRVWQSQYGVPLQVTAVHAGLECGLLKGTYPQIQMVSLGPTMKDVHSAQERLDLESMDKCYGFLQTVLLELA